MSPEFFAIFNAAVFFLAGLLIYFARMDKDDKLITAWGGFIAWMLLLLLTGAFVHVT